MTGVEAAPLTLGAGADDVGALAGVRVDGGVADRPRAARGRRRASCWPAASGWRRCSGSSGTVCAVVGTAPTSSPALGAGGPLLPIEVELAAKVNVSGCGRSSALHARVDHGRQGPGGDLRLRDRQARRARHREAGSVGLSSEHTTLRVELLDTIRTAAITARHARPADAAKPASRRRGALMLSPATAAIARRSPWSCGGVGVGGAWWLRRRSSLSIRNLYAPAALGVLLLAGAVAARWWPGVLVLMPLGAPWVGAVAAGGAGGWRTSAPARSCATTSSRAAGSGSRARTRAPGERLYLRGQGELVHERPWPPETRLCVDDRPRREGSRGCRWAPGSM